MSLSAIRIKLLYVEVLFGNYELFICAPHSVAKPERCNHSAFLACAFFFTVEDKECSASGCIRDHYCGGTLACLDLLAVAAGVVSDQGLSPLWNAAFASRWALTGAVINKNKVMSTSCRLN